jgi:subtilase family serine protease
MANIGNLRVSNVGSQNAGGFSVAFYLSNDGKNLGRLLQTNTVNRLSAGSSRNIPFVNVTLLSKSDKYIIAVIDPNNRVAETNEMNNRIIHQVK